MPDTSITGLDGYQPQGGASAHPNDVFVIVDVVNTSMAASGTDRKVTINQFVDSTNYPCILDIALNPVAQGDLIYRDSAKWAVLAPGTSGYILATQGASANPHWIANSVANVTGAAPLASPTFTGTVTISTASNLVLTDQASAPFIVTTGTTYGTKIGGGTSQKIGFYNATPVVQQSGNVSSALSTLGLIATPSIAVADVTGAAPTASPTFTGTVTLSTATNLVLTDQAAAPFVVTAGTTYGTKIGGATSQKLGFYNATPIVQPSGDLLTGLTNLGLIATPQITHWTGGITSISGTTSVAIDCTSTNAFHVDLETGVAHTFTVSNLKIGQTVKITTIQGASPGNSTITWAGQTIRWAGGSAGQATATATKGDMFVLYGVSGITSPPAADVIAGTVALANF